VTERREGGEEGEGKGKGESWRGTLGS